MRFEEAHTGWQSRRRTQEEAARLLEVCERSPRAGETPAYPGASPATQDAQGLGDPPVRAGRRRLIMGSPRERGGGAWP